MAKFYIRNIEDGPRDYPLKTARAFIYRRRASPFIGLRLKIRISVRL